MSIQSDRYRPSTDTRKYVPVEGKTYDTESSRDGFGAYVFYTSVVDKLGFEPHTLREIYLRVGSSLGLTQDDVKSLMRSAVEMGYIVPLKKEYNKY